MSSARRGSLPGGTARHRRFCRVPSPSMAHRSREPDTRIVRPAPIFDAIKPMINISFRRKAELAATILSFQRATQRSNSTVQKDEAQLTDRCRTLWKPAGMVPTGSFLSAARLLPFMMPVQAGNQSVLRALELHSVVSVGKASAATPSQVTLIARVPTSICTSTPYVPLVPSTGPAIKNDARATKICTCALHPPPVARDRRRRHVTSFGTTSLRA